MATDRDIALVDFLIKQTETGEVRWEPTARDRQFTTSVTGKYNVTVDTTGGNPFEGPIQGPRSQTYLLRLTRMDGQELLSMNDDEYARIKDLFNLVRRQSLSVDAAIDEIIGKTSPNKDLRF